MNCAFSTLVATPHYQCVSAFTRSRQLLYSQHFAEFSSSLAFILTGVTLGDQVGEIFRISLEVSNGSL